MSQPGALGYGTPTDPITALVRQVEDLKRTVAAMSTQMVNNGLITLHPSSVTNDNLVSPVSPFSVYDQASGFAFTTTATDRLTTVVPVPTGFTTALITATAVAVGVNNSGSATGLAVGIYIDQDIVDAIGSAPSGGSIPGNAVNSYSATITGLSTSFTIRTFVYGYPTSLGSFHVLNNVSMSADVLFLR